MSRGLRTMVSAIEGSSFEMRKSRVLSRRSPSTASAANCSCQRQTQVLGLPVSRMIAFMPAPSALSKTICARQTCFRGAFRSLIRSRSRFNLGRGRRKGKCRFARPKLAWNPARDSNVKFDPLGAFHDRFRVRNRSWPDR